VVSRAWPHVHSDAYWQRHMKAEIGGVKARLPGVETTTRGRAARLVDSRVLLEACASGCESTSTFR